MVAIAAEPFHTDGMLSQALYKHPLLRGMLDFVFPPLCPGCGRYFASDHGICPDCTRAIDVYTHPTCLACGGVMSEWQGCATCAERALPLFAYGNYQPPLRDIVIQFKFRCVTSVADRLVPLLHDQFGAALSGCRASVLVPVPLHPSRESRRGYNQAALIAESLAPLMKVPVSPPLLCRTGRRQPQAGLDFPQRCRNIRGAFEAPPPVDGAQRIMLVDDVVTTGATVKEAADTLASVGHRVVGVVALAHGV